MAFKDLRGLLDQDLDLPIGGRTYHVPAPTARVGLRLQLLRDIDSIRRAGVEIGEDDKQLMQLNDGQEIDFYRDCLGTAYDEMLDGGVTREELRVAAGAAFLCWTASEGQGRAEAEAYWLAALDPPKAAASQKAQTPTAAASTTNRRGSSSGTSSRRATRRTASRSASS